MGERTFEFRLRSSHPAPDRASEGLAVEFLTEAGAWETQQLSLTMPGFRLDLIPLQQVEADFLVTTSSDWIVASVEGDFRIRLDASASEQERMKLCPISRNLPEWVGKRIEISSLG